MKQRNVVLLFTFPTNNAEKLPRDVKKKFQPTNLKE